MAVPSDPPTVAPSGWQTFAQNLADTVQDHDTRIADVEAASGTSVPQNAATTGRWVAPRAATVATLTMTNERLLAIPVWLASGTLDDIGLNLTGAGNAGSVIRLGIYLSNSSLQPDGLLFDAGTVAATSTGFRRITISEAVPDGWVYLVAVAQGATTTAPTCASYSSASAPVQTSNIAIALAGGPTGFSRSGVSGALPATFGAVTDVTGATPIIGVRYA